MSSSPDRSRVLYLTHRVPFPPNRGDRIRNYHLLRQLSTRASVSLLAFADEPVHPETLAVLHDYCERVAIVPVGGRTRWLRAAASLGCGRSLSEGLFRSHEADRILTEWQRETPFTSAVVSASSLSPYLRHNGLEQVPGIVDLVDVDSQKWLDFAAAASGWRKWAYRLEGRRVRKLEARLPQWAETVSVVSPAEAELYDRFAGAGAATVAPHGVDLDYWQPGEYPAIPWMQPSCIFVGAMSYRPNVDAVQWFAREVWPGVRQRHPNAVFTIVGQNPAHEVWELNGRVPGVSVLGAKADVRPWLAAATVSIAPMRLGRGVQNKVLEALAMEKPTVVSSAALMGITAEPNRDLLLATSPNEWVDAVSGLFADAERRTSLGQAARQYVETHHHPVRGLAPLLDAIAPASRST